MACHAERLAADCRVRSHDLQQRTPRAWLQLHGTVEGEQGGLDLVRVEVDLSVGQPADEALNRIGRATSGQLVRHQLRMKAGQGRNAPCGIGTPSWSYGVPFC